VEEGGEEEEEEEEEELIPEEEPNDHHEVVILGGGVAGLSAAVYAGRASQRPLVISGGVAEVGSQLLFTPMIDNYPGLPPSWTGKQLVRSLQAHARRSKAILLHQPAKRLHLGERPFLIEVPNAERNFTADTLVIATGAKERWLNAPGESVFQGKYVHTCALCDGEIYEGQDVVIVGGGESAFEAVHYMANVAKHVTLVHRKSTFRAVPEVVAAARELPNVKFLTPYQVKEWQGNKRKELQRVVLEHAESGVEETVVINGGFLAIGSDPNTKFLQGSGLEISESGHVVVKAGTRTETNVAGVFVAGEATDAYYRQAITAAGDGAAAAIDAQRWLSVNKPTVVAKKTGGHKEEM